MYLKKARNLGVAVLLSLLLFNHKAMAAENVIPLEPPAGEWIYDSAGLINQAASQHMNEFLSAFRNENDIEFFAVSVSELSGTAINQFSKNLFEQWEIGKQAKGRGLLFVLAAKEKLVRVEVGYELEPIYTDAFVSYIEHEQMTPFFEQGRVAEGFEATLELIVQRFQQHKKNAGADTTGKETAVSEFLTGGAGVKTEVALGTRQEPVKNILPADLKTLFQAQPSPEATFALYLDRAKRHITDPNLGIFTPETQQFFQKWAVTNAQMDNEYRSFSGKKYEVKTEGDRAVIRFPIEERTLSPFFLVRNAEGWQLDFATLSRVIQFNTSNQWRFAAQDHPYMFAFSDCAFDTHGFPFIGNSKPQGYLGAKWYWYGYQGTGVLIYQIIPGSAADRAGLEVGDIILSYDGHEIENPSMLSKYVRADSPGKTVAFEIVRGSLQESIRVRLDDGRWQEVIPKTLGVVPPQQFTVEVTLDERPHQMVEVVNSKTTKDAEEDSMPWMSYFLIAAGIFAIAGALCNWDWFYNSRKAQFVVKVFTRQGARIFYAILGCIILMIGVLGF